MESDSASRVHPIKCASCLAALTAPIDIGMLVYFRVVFGIAMCLWVVTSILREHDTLLYAGPQFHFSYPGFSWVSALPAESMGMLFLAAALASLSIAVGFCYRLAALCFACGFTYLFLIDKSYYQNHYYLILLLSWIMAFLPCGRALSVDTILWPGLARNTVPAWTLQLVRFRLAAGAADADRAAALGRGGGIFLRGHQRVGLGIYVWRSAI